MFPQHALPLRFREAEALVLLLLRSNKWRVSGVRENQKLLTYTPRKIIKYLQVERLELSRTRRGILNPVRLPIPPYLHFSDPRFFLPNPAGMAKQGSFGTPLIPKE